jgi:hypothetical protein
MFFVPGHLMPQRTQQKSSRQLIWHLNRRPCQLYDQV